MNVKIKKLHPEAVIPRYAKSGDAGLDLTATSIDGDELGNIIYGTGLAIEIPIGYVGLIFPRSSNSKKDLYLTNHVGVIDSGYRGEIMFKFRTTNVRSSFQETEHGGRIATGSYSHLYGVGDKVGQLIIIPYPEVVFEEVDELSDTERGTGGFGHTGN